MLPKQRAPGLRKSLDILYLLSTRKSGLTFNGMRKLLNDSPSATLSRLLKVLIEEKWAEKSRDGTYTVGSVFSKAGYMIMGRKQKYVDIDNIVKDLAKETKESAGYVEWVYHGFVFRCKEEMPDSFHYIDTETLNTEIFTNGFGITCMAYVPDKQIRTFYAEEDADKKVDLNEFFERTKKIRQEGFFISHDYNGIRFVSPVLVREEKIFAGVIGVSLSAKKLSDDKINFLKTKVKEAAEKAADILSATASA